MKNKNKNEKYYIMRDVSIVFFSIIIAYIIVKMGLLTDLDTAPLWLKIVGNFIAGILFTSVFTTAPATIILGGLAQTTPVSLVAIIGGLGALFGNLVILDIFKDNLSKYIFHWFKKHREKKVLFIFRSRFFQFILFLCGALIIASPFPDEIGLALMGLSKVKKPIFILTSFTLNSIGILIIGLIAQNIK
jgi:hypothetical protein